MCNSVRAAFKETMLGVMKKFKAVFDGVMENATFEHLRGDAEKRNRAAVHDIFLALFLVYRDN